MGIMISKGRLPEDVVRWPDDPAARRALESYLETLGREPQELSTVINGRGLDFTGADLSGLELTEAEFSEAVLNGVRLVGASLSGAWLLDADLRNADLSQCNLRKAEARTCRAQGATCRGADVQRADFDGADFRRADLSEIQFGGAWLSHADLRDANLRGCIFGRSSQVTGFLEAKLAGCQVDGATGTVAGPIDVGADSPLLLNGTDLEHWFADRGAPLVRVIEIAWG